MTEASRSSPEDMLLRDLRESLSQQAAEPENHLAPYQAGLIYARLGEYEQAVNSYRTALERFPNFPQAFFNMGAAFHSLARFGEAETAYRQALEIDPDDSETWANMGAALENLEQWDKALESYDKALALDPTETRPKLRIGRIHMVRGAYEHAREQYEEAVHQVPDDSQAWNDLGLAEFHLGRLDEAERCYRKALDLDDALPQAWNNLGNLLLQNDDETGAEHAYRTAAERGGRDPDIWFNLGEFYFSRGRPEAESALRRTVQLNGADLEAWRMLHQWYRDHPNDSRLKPVLEALAEAQPGDLQLPLELAGVQERLDHLEEARETLERIFALEPENQEAHQGMVRVALREGLMLEAYQHMKHLHGGNPEVVDLWVHLGQRLYHQDHLEAAEHCLTTALEFRPEQPELWQFTGELALGREAWEDAMERFENVGESNRNDRHTWMPLIRHFHETNDSQRAIACLAHLEEFEPYLPGLWIEFYQVYEQAGELDTFLGRLERLLELGKTATAHWEDLAQLYEKAGQSERAKACRERLAPSPPPESAPSPFQHFEPAAGLEQPADLAEPSVTVTPAPILAVETEDGTIEEGDSNFSGAIGVSGIPGANGVSVFSEAERLIEESARNISAGNTEAAISTLNQAMKADIPRYRAWFRMGGLFFSLGKFEEAETAFLRATELNQEESKGWYNLGICRAEQGRLDDARPALETCLSLERKFPEAWNWLGLLEFNQGNHPAARRAFIRCLALDRKSKTAWHNLAMLYQAMGNDEEANRCMEHVAELGGLKESEGMARWKITIRPDSES